MKMIETQEPLTQLTPTGYHVFRIENNSEVISFDGEDGEYYELIRPLTDKVGKWFILTGIEKPQPSAEILLDGINAIRFLDTIRSSGEF